MSMLANLKNSGGRNEWYYYPDMSAMQLAKKRISTASLYIMDDDLDTAETRLSAGNSQFHKVSSLFQG